ncbi:MAG: hypothetical protein LBK07_07570 [Tannerella sp.]|jgi:hypothetical protein|nr:hypothetical protein [Tannerella sp.]
MSVKTLIPRSIDGFTTYIEIAYETADKNATAYGIDANEFAKLKTLYNDFMTLQALCADPATATKANRDARNLAWHALEKQWRVFLNKEIRLNDLMSVAQKEVFGILPHDDTRTPPNPPTHIGTATAERMGEVQFDIVVEEATTGKKKLPHDATGSNLYWAVGGVDDPAPLRSTFRFGGFSSNCHHQMVFAETDLAQRAWVYVRYSNQHGEEGPEGPLTSFIIN